MRHLHFHDPHHVKSSGKSYNGTKYQRLLIKYSGGLIKTPTQAVFAMWLLLLMGVMAFIFHVTEAAPAASQTNAWPALDVLPVASTIETFTYAISAIIETTP